MTHYITKKKRRVNDLAPIQARLPPEILLTIISFYLFGNPQSHFQRLHTIAQVCTRWTGMAKEPTFWGVIDSTYTPSRIHQALSISKTSPLDIHYRKEDPGSSLSSFDFLDLIIGHIQRWRSVELKFYDLPSDWFAVLTTGSAPILNSLTVRIAEGYPVRMTIFGGSLTTICHPTLTGVSLPWEAGGLYNLRTLDLSALGTLSPAADQLLDILRSSPSLETLTLVDVHCDHLPPPDAPIDLFALTKLQLTYLSRDYVRYILAAVRFPNCIHLHLDIESDLVSTTPILDSSTKHVVDICRSIITRKAEININLHPFALVVSTYGESSAGSLIRQLGHETVSEAIPWLIPVLAVPMSKVDLSLNFSHHTNQTTINDLLYVLQHVQIIRSMSISGSRSKITESLLHFLATPTDTTSPYQWPLPRLGVLHFQNLEVPVAAVIAMVGARYGRRHSVEATPAKKPIVSLERLGILSRTKIRSRDLNTLRGILGPDVVDWGLDGNSEMEESGSDISLGALAWEED